MAVAVVVQPEQGVVVVALAVSDFAQVALVAAAKAVAYLLFLSRHHCGFVDSQQ